MPAQYDFETRQAGRTFEYVQLLPQAALGSQPASRSHHYDKENVTFTTHYTSDSATFLAATRRAGVGFQSASCFS